MYPFVARGIKSTACPAGRLNYFCRQLSAPLKFLYRIKYNSTIMNRKIIRGCDTVIFIEINDVTILMGVF